MRRRKKGVGITRAVVLALGLWETGASRKVLVALDEERPGEIALTPGEGGHLVQKDGAIAALRLVFKEQGWTEPGPFAGTIEDGWLVFKIRAKTDPPLSEPETAPNGSVEVESPSTDPPSSGEPVGQSCPQLSAGCGTGTSAEAESCDSLIASGHPLKERLEREEKTRIWCRFCKAFTAPEANKVLECSVCGLGYLPSDPIAPPPEHADAIGTSPQHAEISTENREVSESAPTPEVGSGAVVPGSENCKDAVDLTVEEADAPPVEPAPDTTQKSRESLLPDGFDAATASREEKSAVVLDLRNKGLTLAKISEVTGIPNGTLGYLIDKGLMDRQREARKANPPPEIKREDYRNAPPEAKARKVFDLHARQGLSWTEISQMTLLPQGSLAYLYDKGKRLHEASPSPPAEAPAVCATVPAKVHRQLLSDAMAKDVRAGEIATDYDLSPPQAQAVRDWANFHGRRLRDMCMADRAGYRARLEDEIRAAGCR